MQQMEMCRFVEVYGFSASSGLPTAESNVPLSGPRDTGFSAALNENPSSQLRHLDTHATISSRLLPGGLPSLSDPKTCEQEIQKARTRRERSSVYNVYVVFEGSTTVEFNSNTATFQSSEFNVCLDGFSNSTVAAPFQNPIRDVLCALVLSHSRHSIEPIKRIGSVCFLIDSSNKPTYNFNPSVSAQISLASPTSVEIIDDTTKFLSMLPNYDKISGLIVNSLDGDASALQSFISAWTALEIFVNMTQPGRCSLRQKFVSIAKQLDPSKATSDEKEFARLKNWRDSYFHSSHLVGDFPTSSIHNLLMKYLSLRIHSETPRRNAG
ncbi:MAG: hypothetical protein OYH76_06470 [Defluviicoccus sp.]|nr:hypothetical protein [Defluviicoccus sp.]MDE0275521.1 hypothetical protein [Defluviicoccus sp.]